MSKKLGLKYFSKTLSGKLEKYNRKKGGSVSGISNKIPSISNSSGVADSKLKETIYLYPIFNSNSCTGARSFADDYVDIVLSSTDSSLFKRDFIMGGFQLSFKRLGSKGGKFIPITDGSILIDSDRVKLQNVIFDSMVDTMSSESHRSEDTTNVPGDIDISDMSIFPNPFVANSYSMFVYNPEDNNQLKNISGIISFSLGNMNQYYGDDVNLFNFYLNDICVGDIEDAHSGRYSYNSVKNIPLVLCRIRGLKNIFDVDNICLDDVIISDINGRSIEDYGYNVVSMCNRDYITNKSLTGIGKK